MQTFSGKLSFLAAACLFANVSSYAGGRNSYAGRGNNTQFFPLTPRIYLDGTLAPQGFIYSDVMAPVAGNTEGFAFLDSTGKWGTDKGWLGALGGGLREIWRGAIFGGYAFAEYDRTALGDNFWMINPGLEMMSPHWDIRVNGYLPVGDKQHVNAVYFGSQLGITCPTFKGRQQFDQVYNDINEVAPGLDAQVGYIMPNFRRTRVFGGGYYYFFKQAPEIHGLVGGVELPLNQTISLLFRDSYDNVNRNTAVFTLRVYFGGVNKVDENDIHERLLDPMERHIGVLYTGSGIPTEQVLYNTDQLKLQRENIWFFKPGTTLGDPAVGIMSCTYENPCNSDQFNQTNINNINGVTPLANFYLADGGNYLIGPLTLNSGQSIYGRTADFCQIAPGSPVLVGNLILQGNNNLQAFRLLNGTDPIADTAIIVANAPNITIDQVKIGSAINMLAFAPVPVGTFKTGIHLNNAQNVLITRSTVNVADAQTDTVPLANAVIAENNSSFTFMDGSLNVHKAITAANSTLYAQRQAGAVYLHNNGVANLYNNSINIISDGNVSSSVTPNLYIQTAGIVVVNNDMRGSSVPDTKQNALQVTTYMKQSAGQSSRLTATSNGIYVFNNTVGQTTVTSQGDTIRTNSVINNSANGNNIVQYDGGIRINNSLGVAQVNLSNDNFIMNELVQGVGASQVTQTAVLSLKCSNGSITRINSVANQSVLNSQITSVTGDVLNSTAGIYRKLQDDINTTVNINSTQDIFNIAGNTTSNTGKTRSRQYGLYVRQTVFGGQDSLVTINTTANVFNVNASTNSRADSFAYSKGIKVLSRTTYNTVMSLNSTRDVFNTQATAQSTTSTAFASSLGAGADTGVISDALVTVNVTGDNISQQSIATDSGGNTAIVTGVNAYSPTTHIFLTGNNEFKFLARTNNGDNIVIHKYGANVRDDGTSRFINL